MKATVTPKRSYSAPRYPTIHEIGAPDFARVPTRWRGIRALASTLGAAAMSLKSLALDAAAEPTPKTALPTAVAPDAAARNDEKREAPATDVCPLPPAALAGDGFGAFGCVAMNPPVMLPEAEALEIIEREFAKRGIELVDAPELDGVEAPVSKLERSREDRNLVANIIRRRAQGDEVRRKKRRWMLDLGTKDGKIMVEYISRADERVWVRDPREEAGVWSSVSGCDIRRAAELAVKGFSARKEGRPVKIGVFYDPMASVPISEMEKIYQDADPGLDWSAKYELTGKRGRELAGKKLVAQIEAFFRHLANAPDSSSH